MGIAPGPGVAASGAPPASDQANAYLAGTFKAIGPSAPFVFYGAFNILMWAAASTALTTVAGNINATVASAAGLAVGQNINSVNVPPGTTIGALAGLNVTLAIPPNTAANQIAAGADANATFDNIAWGANTSIQLERSFDGGLTWLICGVGGAGQQAIYTANTTVSVVASEPERGVLYRLNCTAYGGTPVNYRLSTSGLGAMAWGVPPA